jgi:hypothetical protein
VIGIMLVTAGLQTPEPAAPSLLGALIVANAATVKGPLSAFDVIPRRIHRLIDPVIFGLVLLTAALPVFDIDGGTRFVIGAVGVVLAFVWWYSSYDPPVRSSAGEQLGAGQIAGRLAGRGVNAWRRRPRQ